MGKIPVYSIVAYSGTGKTTLMVRLIPELKKYGLRVAVLKHDAHEFDIDHRGKDSWRMTQAGADVTMLASATHAAIMENRHVDAEALLARVQDVDIILTEGYKHSNWKKIAVYREASGKPLACAPEECFAVMTDTPFPGLDNTLELSDAAGLARRLVEDLQNGGGAKMLEAGLKGRAEAVVRREDTALAMGSGSLEVYATPCMVALLEKAACAALEGCLEAGSTSVGTKLEVTHDAATPVGMQVWAESEVLAVEGRKVRFAVRAYDACGPIGGGIHERVIVGAARFVEKCQAKLEKQ